MLKVFKISGNIVDNPEALDNFLADYAKYEGKKILVHGGGKIATKISAALGIETVMIDGRRVTDKATIDVVTMVYAGGVNKSIVAKLQGLGVNAWGVCGADGVIMPADKRPVKTVDYGFVGDVRVDDINTKALDMLIDNGYSVVVAPITIDKSGQLLNTNADTVAQSVATAMSKLYEVELVYLFEKSGVLLDINDEASVIAEINKSYYEELKAEKKIFDGMLPKIDNAFTAIDKGVKSVRICNSINGDKGTVIK